PVQPVLLGVTTMVATSGDVPEFVAVKGGVFVVPLANASPIDVLLFVQLYELAVPAKLIASTASPLHATTSDTALAVGGAKTVIGICVLVPLQLAVVTTTNTLSPFAKEVVL